MLLLGVFVLSTSAEEPTERANAVNPYGYGYEPLTDPYLYRIPVTVDNLNYVLYTSVPRDEFLGDTYGDYGHNYAWLSVTYEGQDDNGDLTLYTVRTPFADCNYLANASSYDISVLEPYEASIALGRGNRVDFRINYDILPYVDSIVEAYVYVGVNPLRFGYDSNTSGGNTDEAYQNGYEEGYANGYEEGYSNGYDTASSQIENSNYIKDLGEGFFNGLLDIFIVVEDFEVFGTKLGDIIGYIITAGIVLLLVKVVAFVV